MTITIYPDLIQGSPEWFEARCGILTAGSFKLILTPAKLVASSNEKERQHLYELAAQRITKYVEPTFVSDDMLRGLDVETDFRELYEKHWGEITEVGFVTNDEFGFTLGCSPDGLVSEDGGIEGKSRRQKYQIETITEDFANGTVPTDFILQVQGELLVTRRKWWDFISWHGGLPMVVIRAYPDPIIQSAIVSAATGFEVRLREKIAKYERLVSEPANKLFPTERRIEISDEITI